MIEQYVYTAWKQAKELDQGITEAIQRLEKKMIPSDPFLGLLRIYKNTSHLIVKNLETAGAHTVFATKADDHEV